MVDELDATETLLVALDCGVQPYSEAMRMQEDLLEAKLDGERDDYLLFVTHPPVLTIGRAARESDFDVAGKLEAEGLDVIRVSRGGRVTWHGPGQIVGYPIIALTEGSRDLHAHLRKIETGIIAALADFSIPAHVVAGKTGVWIAGKKIAAIGIAVRSWVTYHGFAINLTSDLAQFRRFSPCGLSPDIVGSITAAGYAIDESRLKQSLARAIAERLHRKLVWLRDM